MNDAISDQCGLRAKVQRLEDFLTQVPQVECPVRWLFAPGVAAREITIPAGTTLIGAVHKTENLAVLSKGRMVLATERGPVEIAAPHILTVRPGDKNAATALEECVWTNFLSNPTGETDNDKLVEMFSESTAAELLGGADNKQALAQQRNGEIE